MTNFIVYSPIFRRQVCTQKNRTLRSIQGKTPEQCQEQTGQQNKKVRLSRLILSHRRRLRYPRNITRFAEYSSMSFLLTYLQRVGRIGLL